MPFCPFQEYMCIGGFRRHAVFRLASPFRLSSPSGRLPPPLRAKGSFAIFSLGWPCLFGRGPSLGVAAPAGLPMGLSARGAPGLARDGGVLAAVPAYAEFLGLLPLFLGVVPVILLALWSLGPALVVRLPFLLAGFHLFRGRLNPRPRLPGLRFGFGSGLLPAGRLLFGLGFSGSWLAWRGGFLGLCPALGLLEWEAIDEYLSFGRTHPGHRHTQTTEGQENREETTRRAVQREGPSRLHRRPGYELPGDWAGREHRFRCPEEGCRLKGRTDWSRYCDFEYSEKPEGTRLRIMGVIHRASKEWREIFKKRPSIERYFSSDKRSRLLDRHQFMGLERVSLHGRMSTLSYLLTAWGRLRAGDYPHMRHMHIRLGRRPAPASDLSEVQECAECCLCPQHDRFAE